VPLSSVRVSVPLARIGTGAPTVVPLLWCPYCVTFSATFGGGRRDAAHQGLHFGLDRGSIGSAARRCPRHLALPVGAHRVPVAVADSIAAHHSATARAPVRLQRPARSLCTQCACQSAGGRTCASERHARRPGRRRGAACGASSRHPRRAGTVRAAAMLVRVLRYHQTAQYKASWSVALRGHCNARRPVCE